MPDYIEPPIFSTGQVLGRANLGILFDNDAYFAGLADRHRTVNCTMSNAPVAGQTTCDLWDGYIFLAADAMKFHYNFAAIGGTHAARVKLILYDDNNAAYTVDQLYPGAGVQLSTGAQYVNLSTDARSARPNSVAGYSFSAGIHRVRLYMDVKDSNDSDCNGLFYFPPHCTFTNTGAYNYATPPTITDGNLSSASHFNTWRANDLYFYQCRPRQPAFCSLSRSWAKGIGTDPVIIWDGWIMHRHSQLRYKVTLTPYDGATNSDHLKMRIYYDYEGTATQLLAATITTSGTTESVYNIPTGVGPGIHYPGVWYRVVVVLDRDTDVYPAEATVSYIHTAPTSDEVGWASIDGVLSPDTQYVYGSTPGQKTRLALLSQNDSLIFERLCWNASVGRRDFAVRLPEYTQLGGTDSGTLRMIRRYDTLVYRSTGGNGMMRWGDDQSMALDDYGDDGYTILGLRSISNLQYGDQYYLENCQFAMEY